VNKLKEAFLRKNEGPMTRSRFYLAIVLVFLVFLMALFYILNISALLGSLFILFDLLILRLVLQRMPEEN
jgi:hypothetical protein